VHQHSKKSNNTNADIKRSTILVPHGKRKSQRRSTFLLLHWLITTPTKEKAKAEHINCHQHWWEGKAVPSQFPPCTWYPLLCERACCGTDGELWIACFQILHKKCVPKLAQTTKGCVQLSKNLVQTVQDVHWWCCTA
jgi:hypothetical protein